MEELRYIAAYGKETTDKVATMIKEESLGSYLLRKYPTTHTITTDKGLYDYLTSLKNEHIKNAPMPSKVLYDAKIQTTHEALGLHTFTNRIQGGKIKNKSQIRIGTLFKNAPLEFLRMIAVHELAHLRQKDHNKAFYSLCHHIEPRYAYYEFDTRLYLIHLERFGKLWEREAIVT